MNQTNFRTMFVRMCVCVCVRVFRHRMKFVKIIGRNTYLILKLQSQRIEWRRRSINPFTKWRNTVPFKWNITLCPLTLHSKWKLCGYIKKETKTQGNRITREKRGNVRGVLNFIQHLLVLPVQLWIAENHLAASHRPHYFFLYFSSSFTLVFIYSFHHCSAMC